MFEFVGLLCKYSTGTDEPAEPHMAFLLRRLPKHDRRQGPMGGDYHKTDNHLQYDETDENGPLDHYYGWIQWNVSKFKEMGGKENADKIDECMEYIDPDSDQWDAKHPGIWKYSQIVNNYCFLVSTIFISTGNSRGEPPFYPVEDGHVSRQPLDSAEMFAIQPGCRFVFKQCQIAADHAAQIAAHRKVESGVVPLDGVHILFHAYFRIQFLPDFTRQGFLGCFTGFNLSAGKLPPAFPLAVTALSCENAAVVDYQGRYYLNRFHICPSVLLISLRMEWALKTSP